MPQATAGPTHHDAAHGATAPDQRRPPDVDPICPHYHRAVELLGQRWTGAIVEVLLRTDPQPLRFGEIAGAIPDMSDRLLSLRLKDLERQGVVERVDIRYTLTTKGRDLAPAVAALTAWGRRWLDTSASSFRPA